MLRIQQDRSAKLRPEQRAVLAQGFGSSFWSVLSGELLRAMEACRDELETATDPARISLLQGEIAAIHVLIDWADATKKSGAPAGVV